MWEADPRVIEEINRHLEGWRNFFDYGYPRVAFRKINAYIRDRLVQHLRRRSQRPSSAGRSQRLRADPAIRPPHVSRAGSWQLLREI
jgi:hypothetical protein